MIGNNFDTSICIIRYCSGWFIMDSQGLQHRSPMEEKIFFIDHWPNPIGPWWTSGEIKCLVLWSTIVPNVPEIRWHDLYFLRKTAFSESQELAGVGGILRWGGGFIGHPLSTHCLIYYSTCSCKVAWGSHGSGDTKCSEQEHQLPHTHLQ